VTFFCCIFTKRELFTYPKKENIMEKFLLIPVTDEGNHPVSCTDILRIIQTSDTVTTIVYKSQHEVAITHAAVTASSEEFRDDLQDAVIKALSTKWTTVSFPYTPVTAVSAIAHSLTIQATV
jgi:hypothetical protein